MSDKFKKGQIPRMLSYTELCRQLGVTGLYTGVMATLFRDVPFSCIYFSGYGLLLNQFMVRSSDNKGLKSFGAGSLAGIRNVDGVDDIYLEFYRHCWRVRNHPNGCY